MSGDKPTDKNELVRNAYKFKLRASERLSGKGNFTIEAEKI